MKLLEEDVEIAAKKLHCSVSPESKKSLLPSNNDVVIGNHFRISVAANQGGRKYMEDRVQLVIARNPDKSLKYAFFGIYDGHGGAEASEFVRNHLLNNIVTHDYFESHNDDDVLEAIREGFMKTHLSMQKVVGTWPRTASGYASTAGTTSSVAFIRNGKLYTGHVGDSAIFLGTKASNGSLRQIRLTIDHKPDSELEQARIRLAGGHVAVKSGVTRVVWTRPLRGHVGPVRRSTTTENIPFLAVARSLGDLWSFNESTKEYVVSPEPDLCVRDLTERDVCLVLATDGLTNVMTGDHVMSIIEEEEENARLSANAYANRGDEKVEKDKHTNLSRSILSTAMRHWKHLRADNISAITVMLDSTNTDQELYDDDCNIEHEVGEGVTLEHIFSEDPETVVRVTPYSAHKLYTYRTPLLYTGALDNNYSSVSYRGPGFLTHDEEADLNAHYRNMNDEDNDNTAVNNEEDGMEVGEMRIREAEPVIVPPSPVHPDESILRTPESKRSPPPLLRSSRSSIKRAPVDPMLLDSLRASMADNMRRITQSPAYGLTDKGSSPNGCHTPPLSHQQVIVRRSSLPMDDDDLGTEEEDPIIHDNNQPQVRPSGSSPIDKKSSTTPRKSPLKRPSTRRAAIPSSVPLFLSPEQDGKMVTRSKSAKASSPSDESTYHVVSPSIVTSPVSRSGRKPRGAARRLTIEDKIMTPTTTVSIKLQVETTNSPSSGVTTRSRNRSSSSSSSSSSACVVVDVCSTPISSLRSPSATGTSRKRPYRMSPTRGGSAGVTPFIQRLQLHSPVVPQPVAVPRSMILPPTGEIPRMRSAPSTPAKTSVPPGPFGSKWSLSKLDNVEASSTSSIMDDETSDEPPSKIRRIYGFMRRLVGLAPSTNNSK